MNIYYLSLTITVLSNIFYHITQKSINTNVNPIASIIATYIIALMASLILYLFYPANTNFITSFTSLNWASYALGITIIGVELGYLLAYRSGWQLNMTAITTTILVTLLLVPIGLMYFHEKLTIQKMLGIFLGIISLILINLK